MFSTLRKTFFTLFQHRSMRILPFSLRCELHFKGFKKFSELGQNVVDSWRFHLLKSSHNSLPFFSTLFRYQRLLNTRVKVYCWLLYEPVAICHSRVVVWGCCQCVTFVCRHQTTVQSIVFNNVQQIFYGNLAFNYVFNFLPFLNVRAWVRNMSKVYRFGVCLKGSLWEVSSRRYCSEVTKLKLFVHHCSSHFLLVLEYAIV